MSGLDELDQLWVLEYQEFHIEEYITCYRGIWARNKEDAIKKGKIWIENLNLEFNNSDDENYPDYKYITILFPGVDVSTFIISEATLETAAEFVRQCREEMV